MTVPVKIAAWVLMACLISGCGDNQQPEDARQLWQRIQAEDYRSFARAPGYETRKPSNTVHSDQVDIYINDVVQAVFDAGSPVETWPVGSLIVKDGFEDDGTLDLVAVLDKREGGWFWAEYTDVESGEAKFSGEPDICVDCHQSGADYVRAFGFP